MTSPRLPDLVSGLLAKMEEEALRRPHFYRDMTPEQKVEFINGEVVLHSPARLRHLQVTKWTLQLLNVYVDTRDLGLVLTEKCLCVFPRNDYEPSIIFFGTEKAASLTPATLKFPVPDLAVEVLSASTEKNDRGVKFEDFAASGVGEYWIIDSEANTIEQYVLRETTYHLNIKANSGTLTSEVIAGFTIPVSALISVEANLEATRALLAPA